MESFDTIFSMTLAQTEKGYPNPIEHVGVPGVVQREKGKSFYDLCIFEHNRITFNKEEYLF